MVSCRADGLSLKAPKGQCCMLQVRSDYHEQAEPAWSSEERKSV